MSPAGLAHIAAFLGPREKARDSTTWYELREDRVRGDAKRSLLPGPGFIGLGESGMNQEDRAFASTYPVIYWGPAPLRPGSRVLMVAVMEIRSVPSAKE
jgi:hypothetical protein